MHRLFVAIDLPEAVQDSLSVMSCGILGARWVNTASMHLTLRFIGEVNSSVFADIRDVLDEVVFQPFSMQLAGVGFFPLRGTPNVVWVGIEKNEVLFQLQKRVESVLVRCGIDPERRKYFPHITLARLKNSPSVKVGDYLSSHALFRSSEFRVEKFSLYSSVLGKSGARHFVERSYPVDIQ